MRNEVFRNLSEEEVDKYMKQFMNKGMSEEDAFTETYSIDCNMDDDDE